MAAPPPVAAPAPDPSSSAERDEILRQLAREIYADSVLLISISEGNEHLIAHVSSLEEANLVMLANLCIATIRAAQATAHFLGEPDRPFEHNMFETSTLRLYAMSVPEDMLLAVITPASTPLGTVRHNLRRSVRELALLASAG